MTPVELPVPGALLRPPRVTDAAAVLALAQDPDVRMWNPRCRIPDEAAAVATCLSDADWTSGATFSVIDEATGAYAGTVALHDIDNGQAHIGYRVAPWTRGRGLATACVRTVAAWAGTELGLRRILLTHAVENVASCRVAGKAGFGLNGISRASKRFGDGLLHDEHVHVREC
ncbi:GNAT family N-acetyltransferase [Actinoplanes sp. RD1]|uniref:GNAT family N-acetyltransferase n=1 Tax=Actinoplanes sp. RD1 TaxID=3064538 RepID=UPI0027408DE6|nr:GNAT family N-acetyltransferase [Actinoplanes sp. RD1]